MFVKANVLAASSATGFGCQSVRNLVNLGQTCYANVIFQLFAHSPALLKALQSLCVGEENEISFSKGTSTSSKISDSEFLLAVLEIVVGLNEVQRVQKEKRVTKYKPDKLAHFATCYAGLCGLNPI